MTRLNFNADLDLRQQYLSMLFAKIPGQAAWTLLDQGRVATPDATAQSKDYNRIGDPNTITKYGNVKTTITLNMYYDHDLEELALLLGQVRPGGRLGRHRKARARSDQGHRPEDRKL